MRSVKERGEGAGAEVQVGVGEGELVGTKAGEGLVAETRLDNFVRFRYDFCCPKKLQKSRCG